MNNEQSNDHLRLSRDEMRALGYRVIDILVEHFDELPQKPVTRIAERAEMERRLREPLLPEYLKEINRAEEEVNFCDYGIQLTRGFRALKLWMSLKVFGRKAFAAAVSRGFELAAFAENLLRELPNWSIVTPAQMGIVTFRYVPQGLQQRKRAG